MPRIGSGDAADRAHDERRAHVLERAGDRHRLSALDPRALEAQPDEPVALGEQPDRQRSGTTVKRYFCIAFSRMRRRVDSNFWRRASSASSGISASGMSSMRRR